MRLRRALLLDVWPQWCELAPSQSIWRLLTRSSIAVSSLIEVHRVLLIDNSAWARLASGRLDRGRAETVAAWMEDLQLATCLPFLLEAGYSARSAGERSAMMADLARLPRVEIDKDVEAAALEAQRELTVIGHHRLPPTDVVISACAHVAGMDVLHYDSDYDLIVRHTSLRFRSEWLAQPGVL